MVTWFQDLKFTRIRKCGSTNGSSPELARRQTEEDAENKMPPSSPSSPPSSPVRRSRAALAQAQSHSPSPSPCRPLQNAAAATPQSPFAPRRPSPLVSPKNNVNTGTDIRYMLT